MVIERFGSYRVELSNQDKLFFPADGITKGDLIGYYRDVAEVMLPHLENRPLTLHRFPDGIEDDGFYQQQASDYFPEWLQTLEAPRASADSKTVKHVLCNNRATLVYLANQGVIAFHGWASRSPRLYRPDRLIFDLDPPSEDFDAVRWAAKRIVGLMKDLGMSPFPMTTGSRGLHVLAPLRNEAGFDEVRELARDMADILAQRHPEALTVEQRKNKRHGRIYLDVSRNAYGQTAVMPYSVRALPEAPVATPLSLEELDDGKLGARRWRIDNVFRRLGQKDDPWKTMRKHAKTYRVVRAAMDDLRND
jgi:bifunctional non-homologous end joining protein LigD